MTISEWEKNLNQNNLNGIYLFYGENTYMLDYYLKKIKKTFKKLIQGINYISLDENSWMNIVSDIETPCFGYSKKLIVIKNSGLFQKEIKSKKTNLTDIQNNLKKYIEENIEYINDSNLMIFYEKEVEKNCLYKTIEKIGNVLNCENLKGYELIKKVKSICKSYEVEIDDVVVKKFIEFVGNDMQELINEIRKLIEYAGKGGIITNEAIDLLTIKKVEVRIFDLTDSLGTKNIRNSMDILNDLLYNKEPIQKILIQLYNHFKKLYIVKLAERYKEDIAINLNLKPNQAWALGKYKKQAGYFREKQLRDLLKEIYLLGVNYKVGKIDLNIGLEAILCKYCSD